MIINGQKLTIIIPTYERIEVCNSLLKYLDKVISKFNIIILDSTKKNNLKNLFRVKNNIIIYKKFSHKTNLAKKIYFGLKLVKSKYTLICADDDFFIPHYLNKYLNFLDKKKDYISVSGNHYIYDHFYLLKFCQLFLTRLKYSVKSNDNKYASVRLGDYIFGKNKLYNIYSISRTKEIRKVWFHVNKYIKDSFSFEECSTSLSLLTGKFKVLNYPFLIRSPNLTRPNTYLKKRNIDNLIFYFLKCMKIFCNSNKIKIIKNLDNKIKYHLKLKYYCDLKKKPNNDFYKSYQIIKKKLLFIDYLHFLIRFYFFNNFDKKHFYKIKLIKKILIKDFKIRNNAIIHSRKKRFY